MKKFDITTRFGGFDVAMEQQGLATWWFVSFETREEAEAFVATMKQPKSEKK